MPISVRLRITVPRQNETRRPISSGVGVRTIHHSYAPAGAFNCANSKPRACARGYYLSPLPGLKLLRHLLTILTEILTALAHIIRQVCPVRALIFNKEHRLVGGLLRGQRFHDSL